MAQRVKNPPAIQADAGSLPGLGRSPGGGHGNPLQDSCLENRADRGAWRAMVHRVAKSRTRLKRLCYDTCPRDNDVGYDVEKGTFGKRSFGGVTQQDMTYFAQ